MTYSMYILVPLPSLIALARPGALYVNIKSQIFSCPQTALWVTLSLTDSKTLLKNITIQHSERLVTLETCDESNEET